MWEIKDNIADLAALRAHAQQILIDATIPELPDHYSGKVRDNYDLPDDLIENFFAKLKQYRAIATRHDKTARNFLAAVHLAAAVVWLN